MSVSAVVAISCSPVSVLVAELSRIHLELLFRVRVVSDVNCGSLGILFSKVYGALLLIGLVVVEREREEELFRAWSKSLSSICNPFTVLCSSTTYLQENVSSYALVNRKCVLGKAQGTLTFGHMYDCSAHLIVRIQSWL